MMRFRQWLARTRDSHAVWLGLVAASLLFMSPLLVAPLTKVSRAGGTDQWQPFGLQGETVLALSTVALGDGSTVFYAQTHTGLWRRSDDPAAQDNSWQRIDWDLPRSALGAPLLAGWGHMPGAPQQMVALAGPTEARQLYRSEDGGLSWQPVELAPGESQAPLMAVLAGAADSPAVILIATAARRLQRSVDGGATWTPGGPWPQEGADGDPGRPETADVIRQLLVQEAAPDHILALSHRGELWASDNGGLSWHAAGVEGAPVTAAAWAVGEAAWAASTRDGAPVLLFRANTGADWEAHSLPGETSPLVGNNEVVALAAEPGILDSVYAAVRGGEVYHTVDRGATWVSLGAPRATHVTSLAVMPGARSLLVVMTDDGLWARPITPVTPTVTPTSSRTAPVSTSEAGATTSSPTVTASATATPTASATSSPTMTPTPSPTQTATATATPTASATPTRKATTTSRPRPTATASPAAPPGDKPTLTPQPPTPPVQGQPTEGPPPTLPSAPTTAPTPGDR